MRRLRLRGLSPKGTDPSERIEGEPPHGGTDPFGVSPLAAGSARAAKHDFVLVQRVAEPAGGTLERALEPLVGERLDLAAVPADEMVMVVSVAPGGLEPRDAVADVHPLDEPELDERVEGTVDARDPDGAAVVPDAVVDLLRGEAAALRGEVLDDGAPRAASA
jgi:hypothetical protein